MFLIWMKEGKGVDLCARREAEDERGCRVAEAVCNYFPPSLVCISKALCNYLPSGRDSQLIFSLIAATSNIVNIARGTTDPGY